MLLSSRCPACQCVLWVGRIATCVGLGEGKNVGQLTFSMLVAIMIIQTYKKYIFSVWIYTCVLMLQRICTVFKKLSCDSLISGCWNICRNTHILFRQMCTPLDISPCVLKGKRFLTICWYWCHVNAIDAVITTATTMVVIILIIIVFTIITIVVIIISCHHHHHFLSVIFIAHLDSMQLNIDSHDLYKWLNCAYGGFV